MENKAYILSDEAPWLGEEVPMCGIPGMISKEERQYYLYVGEQYSGEGALVEIGPWLGRSTFYIVAGLRKNERFKNKKLFVFDDFVWRTSWMDAHCTSRTRPKNHEDFQWLFDEYTQDIAEYLRVEKKKVAAYDGNDDVPLLVWSGGAIEFLYIDCGRTFEVNNAWWTLLERFFIPGKTLIMMQDWQLYKEEPPKEYNQTKQFTDSKRAALTLLHELRDGSLATFVYTGTPS